MCGCGGCFISTISWWLVLFLNFEPAVIAWLRRVSSLEGKAIGYCVDVMKVNTGIMSDCS